MRNLTSDGNLEDSSQIERSITSDELGNPFESSDSSGTPTEGPQHPFYQRFNTNIQPPEPTFLSPTESDSRAPFLPLPKRFSNAQTSFSFESSSNGSVRKARSDTGTADSFDRYPTNEKNGVDPGTSPFGGYPVSAFPLHMDEKEEDDYIHNPDPVLDLQMDKGCLQMDFRGFLSFAAFILLILGIISVFIILPVVTYTGVADHMEHFRPTEIEVLSAYQFPQLSFRKTLVDPDTPDFALTHKARDGSTWELVFSDEFNLEGRTFYPRDDPYWTAVDIHYAATRDLEWYDPDAATTQNGTLVLTLDAFKNHDLYYRSGMVQSWNKMCFTQGYIEISASLPGKGQTPGLWPGLWTMGNLGRPGYLSTTDGVWPYSYDSCDAGITPNQSSTDGISYLPGQKLNKCTCKGEDHPNPGVGRGAPEIDVLEGSVDSGVRVGVVSQSVQVAPFDIWYIPDYSFVEIYNASVTSMNTYAGGMFQEAISGITMLNNEWYEVKSENTPGNNLYYQTFGFEYLNSDKDGYIQWFVGSDPTFTVHTFALGPNGNIDRRPISKEPMSVIMNLGVSNSWTYIDWPSLEFPSKLRIDYVRIYQPKGQHSVTCDPSDYPTYDYIENHRPAYDNANFTLWTDAGYTWPSNTLMNDCK